MRKRLLACNFSPRPRFYCEGHHYWHRDEVIRILKRYLALWRD